MKSGNLNFLEPSGPLQACNGTALPLPATLRYTEWAQQQLYFRNLILDTLPAIIIHYRRKPEINRQYLSFATQNVRTIS